eukprot:jgi/Chrzof1/6927/Cz02g03200.t1
MRMSEMVQRMAEFETRMTEQWSPLWALKERDVDKELDLARTAVESLVRQMATVNRSNQTMQSELKVAQHKQQQWQLATDAVLASLQLDAEQLRGRVDDMQQNTKQAIDELRISLSLQADAHRQDVEQQVQSVIREVRSEVSALKSSLAASSSEAIRDLEKWTKTEMLQLASKLKAVVQSCASQQDQVDLQMEALQQQWDKTQSHLDTLEAEDKRIKKHVVKLEHNAEELQRLSQQAITSEVSLQRLQTEVQQLTAANHRLTSRVEVACSSNSGLSNQLTESAHRLQHLEKAVATHTADITQLAENIGCCLQAARAGAL